MGGFGRGRFGKGPFGEWDWAQHVLYEKLLQIDRDADVDHGMVLQKLMDTFKPSFNLLRRRIENLLELRDADLVTTQYSDVVPVKLGRVISELLEASQKGLDGASPATGEFTAATGRFGFTDRSKVLTISRSVVPANNREFRITKVLGETTVLTEPLLQQDAGPLRWSVRERVSALEDTVTVEVLSGDVLRVAPGWVLSDSRSQFKIKGRRHVLGAPQGKAIVHRSFTNCAIDDSGRFLAIDGTFDSSQLNMRIMLLGMEDDEMNGMYEIAQVVSTDVVRLRDPVTGLDPGLAPTTGLEAVLMPRPQIDLEGALVPRGVVEQGGLDLDVLGSGIVRCPSGRFVSQDVGKVLEVSNSIAGNDGFYLVTDLIDDQTLLVDGSLSGEVGAVWALRVQTDASVPGQVSLAAPGALEYLALDMGLEVDPQETEVRQRSWVRNAAQWFGIKGSVKSYEVLGRASGFDVQAYGVFAISLGYFYGLPSEEVYQAGEAGLGRHGTQGSIVLSDDLTGTLTAPTGDFREGDTSSLMVISGADDPLNNGIYEISAILSGTELVLKRTTPLNSTDANNGAITWNFARLYTSLPPTRPRFDEVNSDRMGLIIAAEPGGNSFRVDKFCWESDFGASYPVNVTGVSLLGAMRWLVEAEDATALGDARSLETVQVVGNWLMIDSGGTEHVLETIPSGGPPTYLFEVLAASAPALGVGVMTLDCAPRPTGEYCAAAVVAVVIQFGAIASEGGRAIEQSTARLLRRFEEVQPLHVRLIPRIRAEIVASYGISAILESPTAITSITASYSARFDATPGDAVPVDAQVTQVFVDII